LRSPEGRQQLSQKAKAGWESGKIGDREWRRAHSEVLQQRWQDPEYQEQRSQELQDAWARGDYDDMVGSEEFQEFHRQVMRCAWDAGAFDHVHGAEGYAEKMARATRENWRQGTFDHVHQSKQYRQKLSESITRAWERGAYEGRKRSSVSPTKPEQLVMIALDFMGIAYEFNSLHLESYTYDFFLPNYGVLIEYDGWYWHESLRASNNDDIKDKLAHEAGYRLIRLKGKRRRDLTGAEIWGMLCKEIFSVEE